MSHLMSLLLLSVLFLQGSLGFLFGQHRESAESKEQRNDVQSALSITDDLNPKFFCQGPCKDGWIFYQGYCHLYVALEKSWKDAENHCQSLFGRAHLTSVVGESHNRFLRALARSMGYLGDKLWTGGNTEKGSNTWVDGTPFSFLKIPGAILHKLFGINKCLCLTFGGANAWDQLSCVQKMQFICIYKPSQP